MRPTKAIIHLDNLQHNIKEVRKRLQDGVKICLAVKADAYGHGAVHSSVAAIRSVLHIWQWLLCKKVSNCVMLV